MTYILKLYVPDATPPGQRQAAERLFREALEGALGDATLVAPSLRAHIATDPMLGPLFGRLAWVPKTPLLWFVLLRNRVRPCNPVSKARFMPRIPAPSSGTYW